jgi:hypothetical protein
MQRQSLMHGMLLPAHRHSAIKSSNSCCCCCIVKQAKAAACLHVLCMRRTSFTLLQPFTSATCLVQVVPSDIQSCKVHLRPLAVAIQRCLVVPLCPCTCLLHSSPSTSK